MKKILFAIFIVFVSFCSAYSSNIKNIKIIQKNIEIYKNKIENTENGKNYIDIIDSKLWEFSKDKIIELNKKVSLILEKYRWKNYNILKYIKFRTDYILEYIKILYSPSKSTNSWNICNDYDCILEKINLNQKQIEAEILANFNLFWFKTFHWKYKINIENNWDDLAFSQKVVENNLEKSEIENKIYNLFKFFGQDLQKSDLEDMYKESKENFKKEAIKREEDCIVEKKDMIDFIKKSKSLNEWNFSSSIDYNLKCKNSWVKNYSKDFPETFEIKYYDFPWYDVSISENSDFPSDNKYKFIKSYNIDLKKWKKYEDFTIYYSENKNLENEILNDESFKKSISEWWEFYKNWNYYSLFLDKNWQNFIRNYLIRVWFREIE